MGVLSSIVVLLSCVFLLLVQSALSQTNLQQLKATIQFDIEGTRLAVGRFGCSNNHHLDILSVIYFANGVQCTDVKCRNSSRASSYLDGGDTVCSNENNIRMNCYGRTSCGFGGAGVLATQPNNSCLRQLPMETTHMEVHYRCLPSENFRDICDSQNITYAAGTNTVLSTTLSARNRDHCRCNIQSSDPRAFLGLNVLPMAALHGQSSIYIYYGSARVPFSIPYNQNYLQPERAYTLTGYPSVIVEQTFPTNISQNSRTFIRVIHDADIVVTCNEGTEGVTARVTDKPTVSSSTEKLAVTKELGGNDGDKSKMMTIIVALSVTLTLLLLAFAAGIVIFCVIKKRRKRRRARSSAAAQPMLPSKLYHQENNNSQALETPDLVLSSRVGGTVESGVDPDSEAGGVYPDSEAGGLYHELEDDDDYAEIPADSGLYPDGTDYAHATQPVDADPYKVTLLQGEGHYDPRLSPPTDYNGYNSPGEPDSQVRNSHGSMADRTDHSYAIGSAYTGGDDHYSVPCDVIKVEELPPSADNKAEYDIPPEPYAATTSTQPATSRQLSAGEAVTLIDNELYEDENQP